MAKKRATKTERISLYPLDPRMVLRRMLNTPPPPKGAQKPAQHRPKRKS